MAEKTLEELDKENKRVTKEVKALAKTVSELQADMDQLHGLRIVRKGLGLPLESAQEGG